MLSLGFFITSCVSNTTSENSAPPTPKEDKINIFSNDGGFKKIHGIEYKIVKDTHGKKAKDGDVVEYNIKAKVDATELADTWKQGRVEGITAVTYCKLFNKKVTL